MVKFARQIMFVTLCWLLSSCVTQNFDKNKLVIEQNTSDQLLAMTRVSLGLGYLKIGNTNQAKFNLEKAKKFAPNLVEVHIAFAHYYETVDETALAIRSFEEALSIKPDDANTLNNFGVFLCRQERFDEAEQQFLKAIKIPSYLLVSQSYENLALCQLKSGNFDKAEQYLAKAIIHSPNSDSALFEMARLEYSMGNYEKSHEYQQKFEKVTRRYKPESLALAVKTNQQLGNLKMAKNYASMLVSMFPDSWEARQYILNGLARIEVDDLAERYQRIKVKKSNKKINKRVVKLSPNSQSRNSVTKLEVNKDSFVKKVVVVTDNNLTSDDLDTPARVVSAVKPIKDESAGHLTTTTRSIHTVVKDENLFSLSIKYNIKMKTLKRWNDFSDNLKIHIGDEIFISEPLRVDDTDD
jgi:type IV pilus assembly protein PilF